MQLHSNESQFCARNVVLPATRSPKLSWEKGLVFLVVAVTLAGAALPGQQPPWLNPDARNLHPGANRLPDMNDQMATHERQFKQRSIDAANAARKKELDEESAKLLALAIALKAEVEKTNKDTLSLSVIRKASEIEKLAHNVKEKMTYTVGPS